MAIVFKLLISFLLSLMNFLADGESDTSCINSLKSLTPILLLRLVLLIFVGSKSFSFSVSSLISFIGSLVLT